MSGYDDERDSAGNLTGLRPIELLSVRRTFTGEWADTPEIDDGMMDDHLRRLVDRANVLTADHLAGRRAIPDAQSHGRLGARMLEEVEGLGERAGELDALLGDKENGDE